MYVLGYSLDNLSLMALTLSVGFVVDDAIVMLENIVRHMEMGKPRMQAALDGSAEIAFTIVSMTLSLAAVFIPVLFMGGIVGRLMHEFAVTIAAAILVSGFVSLTPHADAVQPLPQAAARRCSTAGSTTAIERVFDAWLNGLRAGRCGRRSASRATTMVVSALLLVGTVYLFRIVPTGFIPSEDTGQMNGQIESDPGHRLRAMVAHQKEVDGHPREGSERRGVHVERRRPGRRPARTSTSSRATSAR